ncbi:hypothetical protein GCM10010358_19960 [Streptomyces minutiscleroticus]|uniref:Uncharacterized protein n=1 Tax=Streptomyces minutiscleroticus TaxID=68238 RepID=A0A918KK73_9ACTN|nr:hypothetical protein GCM10010358_19960 [Streptomyces minutiscleroticus]
MPPATGTAAGIAASAATASSSEAGSVTACAACGACVVKTGCPFPLPTWSHLLSYGTCRQGGRGNSGTFNQCPDAGVR